MSRNLLPILWRTLNPGQKLRLVWLLVTGIIFLINVALVPYVAWNTDFSRERLSDIFLDLFIVIWFLFVGRILWRAFWYIRDIWKRARDDVELGMPEGVYGDEETEEGQNVELGDLNGPLSSWKNMALLMM